jgi:NADH dehydrogenase (ubiquinone) 1 beta subcomplex subunit 11
LQYKKIENTWYSHWIKFSSFQYTLNWKSISISLIFPSSQTDWAHREGILLLREREAAGIFPIDKNFVDPAKLELPTDEELGDTPIYC